MILAGDIGGTKTSLAIYSKEAGPYAPIYEKTCKSAYYPSLNDMIREFMEEVAISIEAASFGIAGPVRAGRVQVTNLPWLVDADELRKLLGITAVYLLNDLQAVAWSVPSLRAEDLHSLNTGNPNPTGNIGVIAPGTGLGEAFLTWHVSGYCAYPSEGGHADFAPTNQLETRLLLYLQQKMQHVSYEQVCSGRGIPNIYQFLRDNGYEEPDWLREQLTEADDATPIIVNIELDQPGTVPICAKTLELFCSILAAEAGNMALKLMATGGIYLGGGIPPRILAVLRSHWFLETFQNKGRFTEYLSNIPVHVILNPKAPLVGAACYGLQEH